MYPGEKTEFYGIQLRPEVENFAIHMEQRLRANDHKGKNITWSAFTNSREYFVSRLREEIEELLSATEKFHDEAADVANFALMIALQASLRKMAGIESEAKNEY